MASVGVAGAGLAVRGEAGGGGFWVTAVREGVKGVAGTEEAARVATVSSTADPGAVFKVVRVGRVRPGGCVAAVSLVAAQGAVTEAVAAEVAA